MKENIHNRKYLKSSRKNFRNNATSAEAFLWTYLKNKQLYGRKFRRQHSIFNYIVDFYCAAEKLVIELDGAYHLNTGMQNYDEYRDSQLRDLGLEVLRFENVAVFENTEYVLEQIVSCFSGVSR